METMTASVGSPSTRKGVSAAQKSAVYLSIRNLSRWLEENDYRGYDTFDGLNARFVRPFTFETKILRTVLLQGVRRVPLNIRPLLGVKKEYSSKAMGFLARGFIRLHKTTGEQEWADKAKFALEWLMEHQAPGYSRSCWGNHFDYQARTFYLPKGEPTVVWTALIGHGSSMHLIISTMLHIFTWRSAHVSIYSMIWISMPTERVPVSLMSPARTAAYIMRTRLGQVFWHERFCIRLRTLIDR